MEWFILIIVLFAFFGVIRVKDENKKLEQRIEELEKKVQ